MRNNRHCLSKWTLSSSVGTSWVSVRSSIRSPVHLRSGSRLPVNVLPARKRETSAVQPRSGSNPPVRPRRIARLLGMMSCLNPVQPLSGSRPPVRRLSARLSSVRLVQPRSGSTLPASSLENRKSLCSPVQPLSGSNPPVHWLLDRSSTCSAGSLSSGNGPCSLQRFRYSLRSTALHTAASPKIAAHVPFRPAPLRSSSSSEQPAPSISGTTRSATAGYSFLRLALIARTRPSRACSTTASVRSPSYRSVTRHGS
eukprot:scaffold53944_cov76-Phaeocystis_antarctica.AAC.3